MKSYTGSFILLFFVFLLSNVEAAATLADECDTLECKIEDLVKSLDLNYNDSLECKGLLPKYIENNIKLTNN